ncbi:hypothetical protein G6F59_017064 [Rhizopus arrhizus]|nr:hypothetical protein G6F59_017064 [Rhizopus arrhizus]
MIHNDEVAEAAQPFRVNDRARRHHLDGGAFRRAQHHAPPDAAIRAVYPETALHLPAHRHGQAMLQAVAAAKRGGTGGLLGRCTAGWSGFGFDWLHLFGGIRGVCRGRRVGRVRQAGVPLFSRT